MQVDCNGETAELRVEEFDGHVQIYIKHDFAEAAAAMTWKQAKEHIREVEKVADEMIVNHVTRRLRERYPTMKSWTREYVGYDDMEGGDWYIANVKDALGANLFDRDYEDTEIEEIEEELQYIRELGEHNNDTIEVVLPGDE